MKVELQKKEVLAMYDVRGIQDYIFKSNVAKEIVGASELIEKIVMEGLRKYIEGLDESEKKAYMVDWENDDPEAFLKDSSVRMQVMFVGGGNSYVLFRTGEECQKVSRFLSKYLLNATYSLNLAVASVAKTSSYANDYQAINQEMTRVKACMPLAQPMGALPFMEADSITGYPITFKTRDGFLCTESKLKRDAFPKDESEKIFDNMVTEKGDNSTLAVCHIDGNQMGMYIKNQMGNITDYKQAILTMREISKKIADTFRQIFQEMVIYMDSLSPRVKEPVTNKLYRKIIVAGDDITFVCNAKLAIPAIKYFLTHIGEHSNFSACAGIAYFNSHFPFSDAYQVAEACCENAKERAKEAKNRVADGSIGNFFDFQICTNIRAANLKSYRSKHYSDGKNLFIGRPYYVPVLSRCEELNTVNEKYSIEHFEYWERLFSKMPRNKTKQLRNIIPMGKNALDRNLSFLASRGYKQLESKRLDYPIWYDALEMMDLFIGGDADENKN